jgi:hypothetical protein
MTDPLFERSQLAIETSRKLQAERLRLRREYAEDLQALQFSVLENAMPRSKNKTHRDDREE